jgi:F-box protein 21
LEFLKLKLDFFTFRYYARHVLDSIHRSIAIEEWQSLVQGQEQDENREDTRHSNIMIERCLAALGMFLLHNQYGDIDEVSYILPQ